MCRVKIPDSKRVGKGPIEPKPAELPKVLVFGLKCLGQNFGLLKKSLVTLTVTSPWRSTSHITRSKSVESKSGADGVQVEEVREKPGDVPSLGLRGSVLVLLVAKAGNHFGGKMRELRYFPGNNCKY